MLWSREWSRRWESTMAKIAILGGQFDPPHWGHFWGAQQVLESGLGVGEVWFMPTYKDHWKKSVASPQCRFQMAELLAQYGEQMFVSDLEIKRKGISFTLDTVNELKKDAANIYYWVIGSDTLATIEKWHHAEGLFESIQFIIYPRAGFPIDVGPKEFIRLKGDKIVINNYSSTIVRKRVQEREPITGLVPQKIEEYIYKNKLYR